MTLAQAVWIAEHQIGPNVYGLKWVALLELLDTVKGDTMINGATLQARTTPHRVDGPDSETLDAIRQRLHAHGIVCDPGDEVRQVAHVLELLSYFVGVNQTARER